jgi:hypothetical protein
VTAQFSKSATQFLTGLRLKEPFAKHLPVF